MRMSMEWDLRFLGLAANIASFSKDPSTKVGALIVRPNKEIVCMGFNGFPRGIEDTEARLNNRDVKYDMVIHAEENALLKARDSVDGCIMYCWPFMPCSRCAAKMIQVGLTRVVAPNYIPGRWEENFKLAKSLFLEVHGSVRLYGFKHCTDTLQRLGAQIRHNDAMLNSVKFHNEEVCSGTV